MCVPCADPLTVGASRAWRRAKRTRASAPPFAPPVGGADRAAEPSRSRRPGPTGLGPGTTPEPTVEGKRAD
jgi:hypothetical protein